MTNPLLTAAARRSVARLRAAIAPHAGRLDREFRKLLRRRGHDALQTRAFLAITPAAASRLTTLPQFLEQAGYHGRRLANLNVEPGEVQATLQAFGPLLDAVLAGQLQPAREQLHLATTMALQEAFYQVREAESQAFFALYQAESEALDLDDLLQRYVRIFTRTFRARTGRLIMQDRPLNGQLARPLYIVRGKAQEKLIADPEIRGRFASYWSFPLSPGALLQLGFDTPYPWLTREMTLLHAVAEHCREAIEKARLQGEIRRLDAKASEAEEEERRRIARELHDEAGQSLLALRLQLELLGRDAGADLRPRLLEAQVVAEHTVEEIRRIVAALSPALLERLGLAAAVRQLAARFQKMHSAEVRVRLSGNLDALLRPSQEVVYRVAQEALQNIAKHSQATRVNLLLQSTDKKIRLSVSDNGAGFAQETALSKPMSFGLAGMRERARLLSGDLFIRSAPGKGVTVVLELPKNSTEGMNHGQNSRTVN
jgi:signal transduction histidine kinase